MIDTPMNQDLFEYALSFIGGECGNSYRYSKEGVSEHVDIISCQNGFCPGVKVCSTIGLSDVDIGFEAAGKDLRIELMLACLPDQANAEDVLVDAAFEVIEHRNYLYGSIFTSLFTPYALKGDMKHAILLDPVFWDKCEHMITKDRHIGWLLLVPISDNEMGYFRLYGTKGLETLLEEKKADVLDWNRKSCI